MVTNYGVVLDICGHFFDLSKLKKNPEPCTKIENYSVCQSYSIMLGCRLRHKLVLWNFKCHKLFTLCSVWGHATNVVLMRDTK
jgi:hypothetical protein